jgi:hypothetical protein
MSGLKDMEQLFHPTAIATLKLAAPVSCKIWKQEEEFEKLLLPSIYPFDTLDMIKQSISLVYKDNPKFLPQFLFVGLKQEDGTFTPLEHTWYPPGTQKASRILYLPSPIDAMLEPLPAFITRGGGKPPTSLNPRGRAMIEDIFHDKIPTLYVFPFYRILRLYDLEKDPIAKADWYSRFYPYYPNLNSNAPITLTKEDESFAKVFLKYLGQRTGYISKINRLFEANSAMANLEITGIKQLRLVVQNMDRRSFEAEGGCQSLFYTNRVSSLIPYMRIIPAEGTAITKVLVGGAIPIPSMANPEVISQWAKEVSPTMGHDFLMLKYVHRDAMGTLCPIYGTVRIFHDGTGDIIIQPPKNIKKLEPDSDFRNFSAKIQAVCKDLPLNLGSLEIGEVAMIFQMNAETGSDRLTKAILKKRLAFFSPFFQEISSLKDQPSHISLRYKVVSQYASENSIFAFLTQYVESKNLEGLEITGDMLVQLQEEFQMSSSDSKIYAEQWLERNGTLTVTVPEENEFMQFFNPGIDIHVYAAHPTYTFHVHRVDSYKTFQRLWSLLSLLFSDEDNGYFTGTVPDAAPFSATESAVQSKILRTETARPSPENDDDEAGDTVSGMASLRFVNEDEEEERAPSTLKSAKPSSDDEEPPKGKSKSSKGLKEKAKKAGPIEDSKINPHGWFLKELKAADAELFKPPYATHCGARDERQPAVLNKAQLDKMLLEYKSETDEGSLFFNIYPLKKGEKEKAEGRGGVDIGAKEITITRYGSVPGKENYYFCPALFCLKDHVMVLETDFDADVDRRGNEKREFSCPFCGGREMVDHKKAAPGATVFRRNVKQDSDTAHLFIGFVKKAGLPCCNVLRKTLRITDPEFERLGGIKMYSDMGTFLDAEVVEAAEDTKKGMLDERTRIKAVKKRLVDMKDDMYRGSINYELIFATINDKYVLDENKHPIDPGKIAILAPPFDNYFQQNSSTFVKRATTQSHLTARSRGFVRVGTEIGKLTAKCDTEPIPTESLLGVLAPLLGRNSIEDVRELLLKAITGPAGVKTFVNANFGNLVSEFYVPSDPDPGVERTVDNLMDNAEPEITVALKNWARDHLQISIINESNHLPIRRIYKSYHRFEAFLRDRTQRKDLRHLSTFLTDAGLLTTHRSGLQLIVLEWDKGKENITVRCSPYGFSRARHEEDDFAFVWRDSNGYYEMLLYVELTPDEPANTYGRWKYRNRESWPRIVKDRINEYMSKCQSSYTSIFTSQMNIITDTLVPLSTAINTPISVDYKGKDYDVVPYGLVRDSYNHAVFVLYPLKPNREPSPSSLMVAMPIVDDGYLARNLQLFLDVEDFNSAPANLVIDYYQNSLIPAFSSYPGYAIQHVVRRKIGKGSARGLQLQNGVYIPTEDAEADADLSAYPDTKRSVSEWAINRELSKPCGSADITDSTQKRLEELYQTFRYMVANWIATDSGRDTLPAIEKIIFDVGLPDYEKRKRLEILCGNFKKDAEGDIYDENGWLTWMKPTDKDWDMPSGHLRKNCRVLEKSACTGVCVWKKSENVCALHVDNETEIRSKQEPTTVNTRILFSRRVIDELIHFPKRRTQLLKNQVSQMSAIIEPIRDGDQYIIPEKGLSWLSLLRLDWRPKDKEVPLYYEEMASQTEPVRAKSDLPEELDDLLGSTTKYKLMVSRGGLEGLAKALQLKDLEEDLQAYVKKTNVSIGSIDLRGDVPALQFVRGSDKKDSISVLVFMKDMMGYLADRPPQTTVLIAGFDGALLDAWNDAISVVKAVEIKKSVVGAKKLRRVQFAPSPGSTTPSVKAPIKVIKESSTAVPKVEEVSSDEEEVIAPRPIVSASASASASQPAPLSEGKEEEEEEEVVVTAPRPEGKEEEEEEEVVATAPRPEGKEEEEEEDVVEAPLVSAVASLSATPTPLLAPVSAAAPLPATAAAAPLLAPVSAAAPLPATAAPLPAAAESSSIEQEDSSPNSPPGLRVNATVPPPKSKAPLPPPAAAKAPLPPPAAASAAPVIIAPATSAVKPPPILASRAPPASKAKSTLRRVPNSNTNTSSNNSSPETEEEEEEETSSNSSPEVVQKKSVKKSVAPPPPPPAKSAASKRTAAAAFLEGAE